MKARLKEGADINEEAIWFAVSFYDCPYISGVQQ